MPTFNRNICSDEPRARTRVVQPVVGLIIAIVALLTVLAVPVAAEPKPGDKPTRPGADEPLVMKLDKGDRRALRAKKKAIKLRAAATDERKAALSFETRIQALEDLVEESAKNEQSLRETLETRLVERYKTGEASELADILSGAGVATSMQRLKINESVDDRDDRLAKEHEFALQQLRDAQSALRDERDQHEIRAVALEDRASELEGILVVKQDQNQAAMLTARTDLPETMWSMKGDPTSMFSPLSGFSGAKTPWGGGTRTPSRPASAEQITRVLADPRIDIYAGGRNDIAAKSIDGRIIDALTILAMRYGSVRVTSLRSGHGTYTTSGNVSAHAYGCAADIGSVGGVVIQPSTQGPGSVTEQAVMLLNGLTGDLAPHQIISLSSLGGASLAMGDHHDHIHLGYSC